MRRLSHWLGMIPTRENDWYGLGYFYDRVKVGRFFEIAGVDDRSQGFEAFYNVGLLPSSHFTFDVQWVDPALPGDQAVVVGGRFALRF